MGLIKKIEDFGWNYNHFLPHSSIIDLTPQELFYSLKYPWNSSFGWLIYGEGSQKAILFSNAML
jgi:hypothetical protein